MASDSRFAGSIPAIYEEYLVPVLFAPFARDLVARAAAIFATRDILELAAGTGAVSHRLAAALPDTNIISTDLNSAMLEVAAKHPCPSNLQFRTADAQALPFPDERFDLVIAQFGVMFFPDKIGAYGEARRVLRPGGTLLFNVWDSLETNTGSAAVHEALQRAVPEPKPKFIARTPFGYHDQRTIEAELLAAGFSEVSFEQVERVCPPEDAPRLARGMCLGSPLADELAMHSPDVRARAIEAATTAATELAVTNGGLTMAALVISTRR